MLVISHRRNFESLLESIDGAERNQRASERTSVEEVGTQYLVSLKRSAEWMRGMKYYRALTVSL